MANDLSARLRVADEDTVAKAMDHACLSWLINDRSELLEAFNCILHVLGVADEDGEVFESEE